MSAEGVGHLPLRSMQQVRSGIRTPVEGVAVEVVVLPRFLPQQRPELCREPSPMALRLQLMAIPQRIESIPALPASLHLRLSLRTTRILIRVPAGMVPRGIKAQQSIPDRRRIFLQSLPRILPT